MLSSAIKSLVIYWQGLVTFKKILGMLKERNPFERAVYQNEDREMCF